ncbi:MAG: type II toxin-antitoxin system VapC family toxin [Thiothrix sp.]
MNAPLLYLDTSAWLKLYVEEAGSDAVQAAVEQAEQVCTHLIAYAELRAALAKAQRMNRLDAAQKALLLPIIDQDWETLNVILPTEMLIKRAANLADQFGLRGYDSVYLAAAEAISLQVMPQPLIFACFDSKLNDAAKALGMTIIPT